jgi:SAM-dependent methyltransferase
MRARQSPYTAYARHYDRIGQRRFGEYAAALVLDLLQEGRTIRSVLDVACGTGAAAYVFADRGLDTTGLDLSAEMLRVAESGRAAGARGITWRQDDMRSFETDATFDLCTCFYDAVNYLETIADVRSFADSCRRALRPGGILAFDINTKRKLSEHWADMTLIAADNPDLFLVYRSWYDEDRGNSPLQMTGFERIAENSWRRFDEEHIETAFTISDLVDVLAAAGFGEIRVLDLGDSPQKSIRPGTEASYRVLFIAENGPSEETSS